MRQLLTCLCVVEISDATARGLVMNVEALWFDLSLHALFVASALPSRFCNRTSLHKYLPWWSLVFAPRVPRVVLAMVTPQWLISLLAYGHFQGTGTTMLYLLAYFGLKGPRENSSIFFCSDRKGAIASAEQKWTSAIGCLTVQSIVFAFRCLKPLEVVGIYMFMEVILPETSGSLVGKGKRKQWIRNG